MLFRSEYWEVDDAQTVWTEGTMASPAFPKGWKMAKEFFGAKGAFFTLVKRPSHNEVQLEARAGIHTLTSETARCAGVVADPGDVDAFRLLPNRERMPARVKLESMLFPEQVMALRMLSTVYFREKLLTIGKGRMLPYLPHAGLLGIPAIGVTELAL